MRPEAQREATAQAAPTTPWPPAYPRGEQHDHTRMAELAGVSDAPPPPHTPRNILSRPGQPRTSTTSPHARGTWPTTNITDDIPTVITTAVDQAHRREPDHHRPWTALPDAHHHPHRCPRSRDNHQLAA